MINNRKPEVNSSWTVPDLKLKMEYVAPGSFTMGSNGGRGFEKPEHKVTISKPYWIGKYEVTQQEYQHIMGSNPSTIKAAKNPVESVDWDNAALFCKKINEIERMNKRLPDGYEYRLPTEAEWEFASRGGTKSKNYKFSGSNNADEVTWYFKNSGDVELNSFSEQKLVNNKCRPHNVGLKLENELGLHDMSGNVHELCYDSFNSYSTNNMLDPIVVTSKTNRVHRGGAWGNYSSRCAVYSRTKCYVSTKSPKVGFRLALAPIVKNLKPVANSSWTIPDLKLKMEYVAPGSFIMGTLNSYANEKPPHKVTITKGYWIGKYEVRQIEYFLITGKNPSRFKSDNRPVEQVNRLEAEEFCKKLTKRELAAGRLPDGFEYRLPTEAEWEYAARGGNKSKGFTYSGSNNSREVVWNKHTARGKTHSVGLMKPNELGVHDMSGNVYEWVLDSYHDSYTGAPNNGSCWGYNMNTGIIRGGGYGSPSKWCRVARRSSHKPEKRFRRLGFRIILAKPCTITKSSKTDRPVSVYAIPKDLKSVQGAESTSLVGLAPGSIDAQKKQEDIVKKSGLPLEVETKQTGIKMRLIPAGKFTMGSPTDETGRMSEEVQHPVIISKPFYCGVFEITQAQWKRVMGNNPSFFKDSGDKFPVEQVSWGDCQLFLQRLCQLEKVPAGTYRLLTEAEWEYACRAGTNSAFCYGDKVNVRQAVYESKKPTPVGSFKSNAWGIYDMHGNIWEWCRDIYGNYSDKTEINPAGSSTGDYRVRRGGAWNMPLDRCRSAYRSKTGSKYRFKTMGLRIMRTFFIGKLNEDIDWKE